MISSMLKVIYRELSKQGETDDDYDDDDDAVADDIAQTLYEQEESVDSMDGVCLSKDRNVLFFLIFACYELCQVHQIRVRGGGGLAGD